jgi:hypothetical protein
LGNELLKPEVKKGNRSKKTPTPLERPASRASRPILNGSKGFESRPLLYGVETSAEGRGRSIVEQMAIVEKGRRADLQESRMEQPELAADRAFGVTRYRVVSAQLRISSAICNDRPTANQSS